ncbi:MAG: glucose-6-phosphate dehydrogenase [Sporichthyaceae bacterium]
MSELTDRRSRPLAGPCVLVLFGVTGDLAKRKVLPAIYDLANRGLLPPGFSLVGYARRDWADQDFAQLVHDAVREHARTPFCEQTWARLCEGIRFVSGDFSDDAAFAELARTVTELDRTRGTCGNHAFYLSIPPKFFGEVLGQLREHGLADPGTPVDSHLPWRRVVIEKPFGHDLASARELSAVLAEVFAPEAVFRIDHYLGKETVQNILAVRFANLIFEPLWTAQYVDHVQITMAEEIGIGGRAGYYDGVGAARDVLQNHLLQLLALVAMEEPSSFDAAALRAEKEKVLAAIRLPGDLDTGTARGRYGAGQIDGASVPGYCDEEGIAGDSTTETYAAVRLEVDTPRWSGVPFYLRTGKRLARRVTEVALMFTCDPHLPFDRAATTELGNNAMVLRIQPDEGITVRFGAKVPGTETRIRDVSLDFSYDDAFDEAIPEAYERLILDVLRGEPPLFPAAAEVELSWAVLDPITEHWAKQGAPQEYDPHSWGPRDAEDLLAREGRMWREPHPGADDARGSHP